MRVYVPATAAELAPLTAEQAGTGVLRFKLAGRKAHAVTPLLAAQTPDADQDELEWEAFLAAACDAAVLLLSDLAATPMRVVLSFEVPDAASEPNCAPSSVIIGAADGAKLMAIHVDEPQTAPLIAAFRADPQAPGSLEKVVDADLLWYDPSELSEIPLP